MTYHDRFDEILAEMSALHTKKGSDYGGVNDPYANVRASEEFGVPPWLGAIIRLNDKITRVKSFTRRGTLENESLLDSLRDIAVYGVIAQLLYEEEHAEVEVYLPPLDIILDENEEPPKLTFKHCGKLAIHDAHHWSPNEAIYLCAGNLTIDH